MKTIRRTVRGIAWVGAVLALLGGTWVAAQEAPPAARDLRLQPADEDVRPLEQQNPRTPEEQARVDALAWFMKGQLLQGRNELTEAYAAYLKAAELDPKSANTYRSLAAIAFVLDKDEEAIQHALKAVELDPDDHMLLRRLGVQMASQGKFDQGIGLLEKASRSARLSKKSGEYVSLMRDLGVLYSVTGRKQEAADAFQIVFDALAHPDRFELDDELSRAMRLDRHATFERIGQSFLEAERYDSAIAAFEHSVEEGAAGAATLGFHLARVHHKSGKQEQALAELQKYFDAQLQSRGREPYQLLADILAKQETPEDPIPRLEALAEKDPRNAKLQFYLAEQYLEAERLDEAEKTYRKGLEVGPDAEGFVGLAAVQRRRNQPGELIDNLARAIQAGETKEHVQQRLNDEMEAIAKDDKLLDGLVEVGRKRAEGDRPTLEVAQSLILAKLAAETKRTDAAIEFFRFALTRVPPVRRGAVYEELGGLLLEADRNAEAAKLFREAAEDPAQENAKPNFLFRLSQAEAMSGDTAAALKAIAQARELMPDNPLLHYQEGWIHYHARQWDDALRIFREVAAQYAGEYPEIVKRALFSISNIHVEREEFDKGEAILEKYLAENPDDPGVNNDLGYLWADRGKNLERAREMIEKAVAAEPENPAYLDSMGWVLFRLGRFEEAAEYLEKATGLPGGSDPTIWDHLGDSYEKAGKADKAREAWRKALEEAENSPSPQEKDVERIKKKLEQSGPVEPPQEP